VAGGQPCHFASFVHPLRLFPDLSLFFQLLSQLRVVQP
jgi:hypothetical protein